MKSSFLLPAMAGLALSSVALAAEPAAEKPYVLPDSVATVEGAEIKGPELEKAYLAMLASRGMQPDAVPAGQKSEAYHMVLDDLIVQKLVAKRSAGLKVDDAEVTAAFEKIKGNFGSEAELQKQVEKNGQTVPGLKEDIRNSLRERAWIDSQIKEKAEATDADAEKFYKENPAQFERPERVRASHILIKVDADAKKDVVAKKEKEAAAIAKRVKGGEDFAKLAKDLSEDPSAKENSGDLNFFTKDQMVPEFSNAAFGMKKDEVSAPVRSQFGFHIIKVTDREAGKAMKLEEVKPQLLAYLQRQKKQKQIGEVLQALRAGADVKVTLP